jgi:hypothetical protein
VERKKGFKHMIQILRSLSGGPRRQLRGLVSFFIWARSGFTAPAPTRVKWRVLKRYGLLDGVWVETGTYFGDTTKHLARSTSHIYSIEPSQYFASEAMRRFRNMENVTILHGTSEDELPKLLVNLFSKVNFWLDGHFSAGDTFQGPNGRPIRQELEAISKLIASFDQVAIFIDDIRCFDPHLQGYEDYPKREWLVNWASTHNLSWTIEHDIFIMTQSDFSQHPVES